MTTPEEHDDEHEAERSETDDGKGVAAEPSKRDDHNDEPRAEEELTEEP